MFVFLLYTNTSSIINGKLVENKITLLKKECYDRCSSYLFSIENFLILLMISSEKRA